METTIKDIHEKNTRKIAREKTNFRQRYKKKQKAVHTYAGRKPASGVSQAAEKTWGAVPIDRRGVPTQEMLCLPVAVTYVCTSAQHAT